MTQGYLYRAQKVSFLCYTIIFLKKKLQEAIKKLRAGIAGLNREGRERLLTAFEQVNANFGQLFTHLFGGGEARLVLVESDDPLEAGLEIYAQPPGQKLSTLSLLSGGERSLTALAYLFSVFRSRPSPFYVMDEVEAALDDVNLHRFLDLVAEFRRTAQLIIVSHQKRTMEAADVLYGVTMEPGGSSKVVAERATAVLEA